MFFRRLAFFAAIAASTVVVKDSSTVKDGYKIVVSTLRKALRTAETSLQEEAVTYAKFSQWCKDTIDQKNKNIPALNDEIELLSANEKKYTTKGEELSREQADVEKNVAASKSDLEEEQKSLEFLIEDYTKESADLSGAIKALDHAIKVLETNRDATMMAKEARANKADKTRQDGIDSIRSGKAKRESDARKAAAHQARYEQAKQEMAAAKEVLLQVRQVSETQRIDTFLQSWQRGPDVRGRDDPGAADDGPSAFKANSVLGFLNEIRAMFVEKKRKADTEHANQKSNSVTRQKTLEFQIKGNEDYLNEIEMQLNTNKENLAETMKKLGDSKDTLTDEEAYLHASVGVCNSKASAFESRTKVRQMEIAALKQAIDVLVQKGGNVLLQQMSSDQVMDVKPVVQKSTPKNFLAKGPQRQVLPVKNAQVALAAVKANPGESHPFAQVIDQIKGLIDKLKNQAKGEETLNSFCKKETKASQELVKSLTKEVEETTIDHASTKAEIEEAGNDIDMIASNQKQQMEQVHCCIQHTAGSSE
jgi:chromosome segregation ATPase